jgi:cysteine synthase
VWSAFRNTATAQRIGSRQPFSSNEEYRIFRPGLANEYVRVTDLDCVVGCRRLEQSEAILPGGSLGECLWAVETGEGADTPRRNLRAHFSRPRRTL